MTEQARRGRPPVGGRAQIRLGADLIPVVDRWAAEHDMSRSEAVRHLVRIALDKR